MGSLNLPGNFPGYQGAFFTQDFACLIINHMVSQDSAEYTVLQGLSGNVF